MYCTRAPYSQSFSVGEDPVVWGDLLFFMTKIFHIVEKFHFCLYSSQKENNRSKKSWYQQVTQRKKIITTEEICYRGISRI